MSKLNTISDNFFTQNPEKILGEMSISNYMNQIVVKGNKSTVEKYFTEKGATKSEIDNIKEYAKGNSNIHIVKPKEYFEKTTKASEENFIPNLPVKKGGYTESEIKEHKESFKSKKIMAKGKEVMAKGKEVSTTEKIKSVLSVEDNIKKYTPYLSDNDIKGFVWYNRTMGIPMTGWEKWFIKGTTKNLVKAKEKVEYLNNKWEVIGSFEKDQEVGKATKFEHKYLDINYVSIRSKDGSIVLVDKSKLDITSDLIVDKNLLDELVMSKSLMYLNGDYLPLHIYSNTDYQILKYSLEKDETFIIEKYGKDVYEYHKSILESYNSFRIDEPNKDKRYKLNPFGDIAREFILDYDGIETNLQDAFLSYCRNLKQSEFELVSKSEFTNIIIYNHTRAKSGLDDDQKEAHKVNLNNAFIEAERLFSEFLYGSIEKEYQVKLNVIINETYNRSIIVRDDKIPVGFKSNYLFNNNPFNLMDVQVEAFKYAVARNSFCLALTVGFGKTSTAIAILSYLIGSGIAKRPMVVVPKPVMKNWIKEINGYWSDDNNNIYFEPKEGLKRHYGILSDTGVNLRFLSNLNVKYQKQLQKNPIKDNEIILVSYEALEKLYIQDNNERQVVINNWLEILEQVKEDGKEDTDRESSKKLLTLIKSLNEVDKNAVIPIDKTKIDFIIVDEAHRLKNMFVGVNADKTSRIKSGFKGSQSARALRAFYISQYMHKNHKGHIGFLTATPFSNSPLEVFTMMCFLGYNELVKNNVFKIQKFVEAFFNETLEYTVDSKNRIVSQTVMKKYKNKRILYKLLTNIFLYRDNPLKANITRPCIIRYPNNDQKIILKMSELQMMQRGYLANDRKIIQSIEGKVLEDMALEIYYRNFKRGFSDMVNSSKSKIGLAGSILASSKISAISPFAQSPVMLDFISLERWKEVYDYSPKIKFTVDSIKKMIEYHKDRGEKESSFVIYCAMGTNILPYIKQALEEVVGFKKNILSESDEDDGQFVIDEVEIFEGSKPSPKDPDKTTSLTDKDLNRRDLIQDLFNEGKVKVIIGTSTIKEGVNLQKNSATLFNLTPDWNSTDVKQLEGRIHRQGNRFGYARIITPLVIGTLDSFIYQKFEEKEERLKDIWEDDGQMVTDDLNVEIPPEKQKELILSDETQIANIRLDMLWRKVLNQYSKINDDIELLQSSQSIIDKYNKFYSKCLEQLDNLKETIDKNIETLNFVSKQETLPKGIKRDRLDNILEYYSDLKKDIDLACKTREAKDIVNILSPSFLRRDLSFSGLIYEDREDFQNFLISKNFKNATNLVNKEIAIYPYSIALLYIDHYGNNTSNFRELKDVYSSAKLVERDILIPNELNLSSDTSKLAEIAETLQNKKQEHLAYVKTIFENNKGGVIEEYRKNLEREIKEQLDKENSLSFNADQMVDIFTANTNMQLSYLKDDVNLEKCPIPKADCCPTNGEYEQEVQRYVEPIETEEEKVVESIKNSEVPMYTKLNYVLPFMQKDQRLIVKNDVQEFKDVIDSLYDIISTMPVTYGQDGVKDPIVYLHYFAGSQDWYITEKDSEKQQLQAFGYGDLGYGAEISYISIDELTKNKYVNLDFHFEPKKWSEISGEAVEVEDAEQKVDTPQASEREYFTSFLNDINISIKYADNDEEKAYFEALKSDIEISLKYSE